MLNNIRIYKPATTQGEPGLESIRERFIDISERFALTMDQWEFADLRLQDERHSAGNELAGIFNHQKEDFQSPLFMLDKSVVHDLRARISIITNALSLICTLEKGPGRVQFVNIANRNLRELAGIVSIICNSIAAGPAADAIGPMLIKMHENLDKLTTRP